ncbi:hypothetical protein ACVIGB_000807 [Bradyrhizobium sp. USDA 4341]
MLERDRAIAAIAVPRLWISPSGEALNCDELDLSHGMMVARDPERFGLAVRHFEAHLAAIDAGEDVEFDFDAAIALAQSNGWARLSLDARSGIAISAADRKSAQRGVRVALQHGPEIAALDVEIASIVGDRIVAFYYQLDFQQISAFVRSARLPRGHRYELPLGAPELTRVAAEAATGMRN